MDSFTCRYCGKKADRCEESRSRQSGKMLIQLFVNDDWRTFELDHKKPRSKGGSNHTNNLLTSCARCNNKKATLSYKEFITQKYGTA